VAVIVDETGSREWRSVVGHAAGELVAVPLVSVSSDALRVVFNGSAGGGTAVDFTQSDTISVVTDTETVVFDATRPDAYVAADDASVSLLNGGLIGSGDVTFRSAALSADLDTDSIAEAVQLVSLTISDASLTMRVIEVNEASGALPFSGWSVLTGGLVTLSRHAATISSDVAGGTVLGNAHFAITELGRPQAVERTLVRREVAVGLPSAHPCHRRRRRRVRYDGDGRRSCARRDVRAGPSDGAAHPDPHCAAWKVSSFHPTPSREAFPRR